MKFHFIFKENKLRLKGFKSNLCDFLVKWSKKNAVWSNVLFREMYNRPTIGTVVRVLERNGISFGIYGDFHCIRPAQKKGTD